MATATTPFAGAFDADPVHSSFNFAVRYQGVSLFRGSLDEVTAALTADDNGTRLEGSAKVESISIRTPEQFRAHVLSEEFFDAGQPPGDHVQPRPTSSSTRTAPRRSRAS